MMSVERGEDRHRQGLDETLAGRKKSFMMSNRAESTVVEESVIALSEVLRGFRFETLGGVGGHGQAADRPLRELLEEVTIPARASKPSDLYKTLSRQKNAQSQQKQQLQPHPYYFRKPGYQAPPPLQLVPVSSNVTMESEQISEDLSFVTSSSLNSAAVLAAGNRLQYRNRRRVITGAFRAVGPLFESLRHTELVRFHVVEVDVPAVLYVYERELAASLENNVANMLAVLHNGAMHAVIEMLLVLRAYSRAACESGGELKLSVAQALFNQLDDACSVVHVFLKARESAVFQQIEKKTGPLCMEASAPRRKMRANAIQRILHSIHAFRKRMIEDKDAEAFVSLVSTASSLYTAMQTEVAVHAKDLEAQLMHSLGTHAEREWIERDVYSHLQTYNISGVCGLGAFLGWTAWDKPQLHALAEHIAPRSRHSHQQKSILRAVDLYEDRWVRCRARLHRERAQTRQNRSLRTHRRNRSAGGTTESAWFSHPSAIGCGGSRSSSDNATEFRSQST
eukprot:CAMPEP_0185850934 /NCGR_PEP_ID=MMETSP1354-20130828/4870_1 /TAXON_ID=708628 /ORGANISM="Erythrolobus madagascarensis, Strain CCMP3276" /LENGTH=508 /DNA_ID=CAMNT_0028551663 /DNA_START=76 /DNA_END=1602 /DNA_ORIENTATION=+